MAMGKRSLSFERDVLPRLESGPDRAEWLAKARAVARRLGASGRIVDIDDVRAQCPPPEGIDPRINGAVFLRAEWKNLGYRTGSRPLSHNRPIARFRLRGARSRR